MAQLQLRHVSATDQCCCQTTGTWLYPLVFNIVWSPPDHVLPMHRLPLSPSPFHVAPPHPSSTLPRFLWMHPIATLMTFQGSLLPRLDRPWLLLHTHNRDMETSVMMVCMTRKKACSIQVAAQGACSRQFVEFLRQHGRCSHKARCCGRKVSLCFAALTIADLFAAGCCSICHCCIPISYANSHSGEVVPQ